MNGQWVLKSLELNGITECERMSIVHTSTFQLHLINFNFSHVRSKMLKQRNLRDAKSGVMFSLWIIFFLEFNLMKIAVRMS